MPLSFLAQTFTIAWQPGFEHAAPFKEGKRRSCWRTNIGPYLSHGTVSSRLPTRDSGLYVYAASEASAMPLLKHYCCSKEPQSELSKDPNLQIF